MVSDKESHSSSTQHCCDPLDRRLNIIALIFVGLAILTAHVSSPTLHASQIGQDDTAGERSSQTLPFTVSDSIEMTHIVDPPEDMRGGHPLFSPDGSKFLVVTERGCLPSNVREYSLLIYKVEDLNEKPVLAATFRSSSNRPGILQPRWMNNDSISLVGENPGESPQIYFINCHTRQVQKVTSDSLGVVSYALSRLLNKIAYYTVWSGDEAQNKNKEEHGFTVSSEGLADLITGQWRGGRAYELRIKNGSESRARNVQAVPFQSPATRLQLWLSPDGRYAITEQSAFRVPALWESYQDKLISGRVHQVRQHETQGVRPFALPQMMLVDMETAEIRPLVDAPVGGFPSVVWSTDSRSVIVSETYLPLDTESPTELARRKSQPVLASFDVKDGSFSRIAGIPSDEVWAIQPGDSPDTFTVRATKGNEDLPTLEYRRKRNVWVQDKETDGGRVPNIRISQTLDHWPQLVMIDSLTGKQSVVFDPNPQLASRRLGKVEIVRWTGKRHEELNGGLVYPVDYVAGKRYPLVIQTHGFDPRAFLLDGSFTTAMAAQELANRGIAVLQVGDSPLAEENERTLDFAPPLVSQIESAVDYLDKLGIIDRERVGLVGFSSTGLQVRETLALSQYRFAAATSAEGEDYGYWQYLLDGNNPNWLAQNEATYGGPPWINWKPWLEHSLSFNYQKIHTPMRLESDSIREVAYEWENFISLKRLHKPVELIFIPGGAHPVVKPWDRMTSQQGNVDWMTFWLKGEEDPDPAKAAQYARWREMRNVSSIQSAAR
jgi:dipeptidyl aminopeptidase/acylaminoacyl peptidase